MSVPYILNNFTFLFKSGTAKGYDQDWPQHFHARGHRLLQGVHPDHVPCGPVPGHPNLQYNRMGNQICTGNQYPPTDSRGE